MSRIGRSIGIAAALLAPTGCAAFGVSPAPNAGDGRGHRVVFEAPASATRGVCPQYRANNPGKAYYWDRLAFRNQQAAEIHYCSKVDTGELGHWVVEERSDENGAYSISAYLDAATDSVVFDWGDFNAPTLWVHCWHSGADEPETADREGGSAATPRTDDEADGPILEVWLSHFGPPQREYGEPTPVQYSFDGQAPSSVSLWWGHPGQAEFLWSMQPESTRFANNMRQAATDNEDDEAGPLLKVETWEGFDVDALGASQGMMDFDLAGLKRAAFPVFDACGTR